MKPPPVFSSLGYTKHMIISSSSNPKVHRLQKLLRKKKLRQSEGLFVAEGIRLVEEALKWGVEPVEFYWGESISERGFELVESLSPKTDQAYQLSDTLIAKVSDTTTSQGVIGVFAMDLNMPVVPQFMLIADLIRDPGNMGTLMRSAKAMGVDGIITTPGTVDAYSPKVVRSAMGVHFAVPVISMDWEEINSTYPKGDIHFWTTVVEGGESIIAQKPRFPIALVVGGEADGVSQHALERSDVNVTIPMVGKTESLNAGVAGSLALYEIMRKRCASQAFISPGQNQYESGSQCNKL